MSGINLLDAPIFGKILRHQITLNIIRVLLLALFLYAVVYGYVYPDRNNLFTTGLFWGLFWPFFMVVSLPTVGKVFCMVCPHGFIARTLTKLGLKKNLPKQLKNPMIGFYVLILVYWVTIYTFPATFNKPLPTAILFTFYTAMAVVISSVFSNVSYCKYFCPIGAITTAFHRTSFTWLSTKHQDCASCKKPECVFSCPYKLNPSKFDQKNSMYDCTLCMECASACKSVTLEIRKWGHSLYRLMPAIQKYEVLVYIILTGVISITMKFHHGLSRTAVGDMMPWNKIGKFIHTNLNLPDWVDMSGFVAMVFGTSISVGLAFFGGFAASKIMNIEFDRLFYQVGYGFAPLMIVGGLSHVLSFFFIEYYAEIVNGFSQAFNLNIKVEPLASRKDWWIRIFTIFNYIAAGWSFYLIYKRLKFFHMEYRFRFFAALLMFSLLPIFYTILSIFQMYAMLNYPPVFHKHH